jgi:NAD(P)-dependent dehydrogenase (short-subunit alcohol dehydrogenase family)
MPGICQDRIAIVTGAGRGIGRGHALELARQGARVVVNDLGGDVDGSGHSGGPAEEVAAEIRASGGEAVSNTEDVASWDGAKRLIQTAIDRFGGLDVLVNNAGILRDRMLFNMSEQEWDAVIHVHLKGTFCPARHAAEYWRRESKAGRTRDARLINTTSVSGTYGNPGQSNYGAAKSGIASFTIIVARELERYGVTANAVSPGGRTRMTENLAWSKGRDRVPEGDFDPRDPNNVAPIVAWLASGESKHVTGRVFESNGGRLGIAENWRRGPAMVKERRWAPDEIGAAVEELLAGSGQSEPTGI